MNRAACTIASLNYLPYARTLCDSYLRVHPDHKFYILLVDRLPEGFDLGEHQFELILVEDLGIPNFHSVAFKYDILELNTNVKPTLLRTLLARGVDQLIYFDPDILIYSKVDPVFEALDSAAIVLTPHAFSPNSNNPSSETHLLRTGVYNLGFIAVSNVPETICFLNWWEHRCLDLAFDDRQNGLFVDQKWINLVPCFFESYRILKHPGCNVAYWNLHERALKKEQATWTVNGVVPLIFYHFSGVTLDGESQISKHSDQFNLTSRSELLELFADYRQRLIKNGMRQSIGMSYAYGRFSDGTFVNKLQRAAYHANLDSLKSNDPFDATGPFYAWAKQNHLQSPEDTSAKYNKKSYNKSDAKVRFVNTSLWFCLRVLGADRYTVLMKYLAYISNLRNQKDIFGDGLLG